jgi:hypothetical protein
MMEKGRAIIETFLTQARQVQTALAHDKALEALRGKVRAAEEEKERAGFVCVEGRRDVWEGVL